MNYKFKNSFLVFVLFFCIILNAQKNERSNYLRYVDSADIKVDDFPDLAELYLDSIPKPLENHIDGHLANYYYLRGLISDRSNNRAELFQDFLMALKYAKLEENYDIAGIASIEIFYNTFFLSKSKDSTAFNYLKEAKEYFEKANNYNGLIEVEQMYAYVELYKENYDKSNSLILPNLQKYKDIKDDGYYYLYALFILSSNYIHQEDLGNSHKYLNRIKALKSDTTISKYLLDFHKSSINLCIADYHLDKKDADSTQYYLNEVRELKYAMSNSDFELYFKFYASYYDLVGDSKNMKRYVDSLAIFQTNLIDKNLEASLKINESLKQSENLLDSETNKRLLNRNLIVILCLILLVFLAIVIINYKKFNKIIASYINREEKSEHLKSKNEKLKVKVVGLEQYILKLKDDVKMISTITEPIELRKNIKELYKDIHLKSTTELKNGENHLDLINDLNAVFFNDIKNAYPQLNDSEIIICYYIFTGFKNIEIANFLNASIRSVESKRYRISKKLEIDSNQTSLAEHLQNRFS
ncbi:helix-turn-helix transcriptional regulator [Psychroserpens sp. Hel_I_66]|uniref:helix-turn-helix transcriptional regulator n=1 Tax=Psychroserpens sp. Hel_I_66 TaxID=1250004 RepID=UPI000646BE2B|nr:LuxR C-terminal-related transcriptional regulator [Psychroserpens sp. Hel_I_66]